MLPRGIRSGLGRIHNGKGRPELAFAGLRYLSTRPLRPSLIQVRLPLKTIRTPSSTRAWSWSSVLSPGAGSKIAEAGISPPLKPDELIKDPSPLEQTTAAAIPQQEPVHTVTETVRPPPQAADEWQATIDQLNEVDLANITPHIGWLRELGLDFGWGSTSMMQFMLERIHFFSGMPWWGSILTVVVGLRVLLFPLFLRSSDMSGRLQVAQHHLKDVMARVTRAKETGDTQKLMEASEEMRRSYKLAGIKMSQIFMPMVIQIPLAFGAFRLLRNMSELPVPGLDVGGLLWFKDLTVADPYFILPVATSGLTFLMFKLGGEMGTMSAEVAKMRNFFLYAFPAISLVVTAFFPAGLQLTFFATSIFAVTQSALLRNPKVRAWAGIQPLATKRIAPVAPAAPSGGYTGTITTTARVVPTAAVRQPSFVDQLAKETGAISPGVNTIAEQVEKTKKQLRKEQSAARAKAEEAKRQEMLAQRIKERADEEWRRAEERRNKVKQNKRK